MTFSDLWKLGTPVAQILVRCLVVYFFVWEPEHQKARRETDEVAPSMRSLLTIPALAIALGLVLISQLAGTSLFPILLNTYGGVRSIDPVQLDTARTLGLTTLQTMREVVLPAASPQILTGMRISLAISLILAILSEMIVSSDGLGYFTLLAERTFKVPEMYAGIFTLALFGYVLNRLFLVGEAVLIRWHHESSGRK